MRFHSYIHATGNCTCEHHGRASGEAVSGFEVLVMSVSGHLTEGIQPKVGVVEILSKARGTTTWEQSAPWFY